MAFSEYLRPPSGIVDIQAKPDTFDQRRAHMVARQVDLLPSQRSMLQPDEDAYQCPP